MRPAVWGVVAWSLCGFELLSRPHPEVERGNGEFRARKFAEAEKRYRSAKKDLPKSPEVEFDLGTALLAQGRHDEAVEALSEAARLGAGARAHYNLGNAHLGAGRAEAAAEAYRRALRADPTDVNAKWNLELALRKQQEEQQRQQQQQEQQEQQPQQEQPQQEQPQQEQEQQQQQQQSEQGPGPRQDSPQEQPAPESQPAEPERADEAQADEAILDALERGEKNLQAERLRTLHRRRRVEKDW